MKYIQLKNRVIINITGQDVANFLQAIITNNIHKLESKSKTSQNFAESVNSPTLPAKSALYALMLTPQGKFFCDFFITKIKDDDFLLDVDLMLKDNILKKFNMLKLRAKIAFQDMGGKYKIFSQIADDIGDRSSIDNLDDANPIDAINTINIMQNYDGDAEIIAIYPDPRNARMGSRIITKGNFLPKNTGDFEEYELLRIKNTIPDATADLITEKDFPLQNNFNNLNAIDYNKGCYIGQEVTARSHHRGKQKKFLKTICLDEGMEGVQITKGEAFFKNIAIQKRADAKAEAKKDGVFLSSVKDKKEQKTYAIVRTQIQENHVEEKTD